MEIKKLVVLYFLKFIFAALYKGKRKIKLSIKIFLFFLLLFPTESWSSELKTNSSMNLNYYKKKINTRNKRISVINKIRFVKEDSQEVDYKKYMRPLKLKKQIPEIAVSRDGSTVVTIKTIKDKNIQEFRLWKLEISDKDAKLKSFGAFQVDLQEFKIDIPTDLYIGENPKLEGNFLQKGYKEKYVKNINSLPFWQNVNGVSIAKSSFEDRQKITLSEIAISDDGSKIAFAFRNQDRSAIDLAILNTENGKKEFLSQVALDKQVHTLQADIPLTCGLAFHPIRSELILCREALYVEKVLGEPLNFRLSSIDLKTGKVILNSNSSTYITAKDAFVPISFGIFPTGTLKISKDGKSLTTNTNGYCLLTKFKRDKSIPSWLKGVATTYQIYDSKSGWCSNFSPALAFKLDKDYIYFDNYDILEDFDLFLQDLGDAENKKDVNYESEIKYCLIEKNKDCLKNYIYKPFTWKAQDFLADRKFILPVSIDHLSNGYNFITSEWPNNGFYFSKTVLNKELKKQKLQRFPERQYDFGFVPKSSKSLVALSNDESLIYVVINSKKYFNNSYQHLFHIKDQKLIPIKYFSNEKNLFTAITPVGNKDFVAFGYDIEHIKNKEKSMKGYIDTGYLQQKGIELLKAGFEEEAMENLLKSFFNNDSWYKAPYLTLHNIFGNTFCHDLSCNNKVETKLPIEFKIQLLGKLHSQRIINNSTPLLDETEQQRAQRLRNLSYAYFNYASAASYNRQFGLVDQALNKLDSVINDPANTKLKLLTELHYGWINLLRANVIAQSELKKAYGFLLQKDNLAKTWGWKKWGLFESVQTLKQDRKKLCYILKLEEKDCKSKYLDKRDYKNHDFVDLNGKLIKVSNINKSLPKLKTVPSKATNQNSSKNPITILD